MKRTRKKSPVNRRRSKPRLCKRTTSIDNAVEWILDHKTAEGRPPGGGPVSEWDVRDTPGLDPSELRSVIHKMYHDHGGDPTFHIGSMYEDTNEYEDDGDGEWWLRYPFRSEDMERYNVVFVWPNAKGGGYYLDHHHAKDPAHFVMREGDRIKKM